MTSKPVPLLLADLGLTKSHSRPHVSNDNPYSEAQFKTLKYRPDFPERFGGLEHARSFCHEFFTYYNTEHRHWDLVHWTPLFSLAKPSRSALVLETNMKKSKRILVIDDDETVCDVFKIQI